MRILVTGSRTWTDKATIRHALFNAWREAGLPEDITLVSGACPTGADRIAEVVADGFGWTVELHPADWPRLGKAAGPVRNKEMVDLGADVCLAFPVAGSRGTVDCMKAARKAKIPVVVYPYPGS